MKFKFCAFAVIIFIVGCRWATDPTPRPSASIGDSKKDSLFFHEYQPQDPYLKIEGYDFKIKEVWTELIHVERTSGLIPGKGYDFVMTFEENPDTLNFQSYTKSLSFGSHLIWFFLRDNEFDKDTLVLRYLDSATSKNLKIFMLFKKK